MKCQGDTIHLFVFLYICWIFLEFDSRGYNPRGKLSKKINQQLIITAAERAEFPDSNSLHMHLPPPTSSVCPPLCYTIFRKRHVIIKYCALYMPVLKREYMHT